MIKPKYTLRRWLYEQGPQSEFLLRKFDNECEEIETEDLSKVTRLEVIENSGCASSNMAVKELKLSFQDEGRTLKVFCSWSFEENAIPAGIKPIYISTLISPKQIRPKAWPEMHITYRKQWRQMMGEFICCIENDVVREQMEGALKSLTSLDEKT